MASAGYGSDHTTAVELLDAVKSAEGLAVAIVLKPFGFEGQRRQHEVIYIYFFMNVPSHPWIWLAYLCIEKEVNKISNGSKSFIFLFCLWRLDYIMNHST